jgi:hypothetical protein
MTVRTAPKIKFSDFSGGVGFDVLTDTSLDEATVPPERYFHFPTGLIVDPLRGQSRKVVSQRAHRKSESKFHGGLSSMRGEVRFMDFWLSWLPIPKR